ncbi:mechanosensitive ion channel [Lewinella sp. JB7]|uniref:mechanosensitive ion channel n=1 Tax=Lewinella sp. JB7 TaxID=2962887 RepID=UPI0020C9F20B|nr:mechanosensitive ion channel [Lewinella sp. JB7]MCP9235256.1 mechanosensitive ion channel [Lewinella sp. JB7]
MDFSTRMELWLDRLGNAVPDIIAALLILVIGYFVAKLLQKLTEKLLKKTDLDNRVARGTGSSTVYPERALAKLVFYIVMVMVLLAALDVLGINSVMRPLNDMVGDFLAFIPNIVGAVLIGFIGYVIAKIASGLVGMAAGFLEGVSQRAGLKHEINLTRILQNLVFILVFIPILIAALDALRLDSITEPANDMLRSFLEAIPRIFAAAIIIGLFYIGGKFVTGLLQGLLESMGTDRLANRLELDQIIGTTKLSTLLANVAFFFIMFLGILTGVEQLEFDQLSYILGEIFEVTGQIAFGLVILVLGNYLANLAYRTMSSGRTDTFLAGLARIVILGLFLAIALRTMGIADDIVNLAFGLTLGAVAVAVALSFGLGGREAAGEQMRRILDKFNEDKPVDRSGDPTKPDPKRTPEPPTQTPPPPPPTKV